MTITIKHYGTKGMKWGVKNQRALNTYSRVARGEASALDVLQVSARMPLYKILVGKNPLRHMPRVKPRSFKRKKTESNPEDLRL